MKITKDTLKQLIKEEINEGYEERMRAAAIRRADDVLPGQRPTATFSQRYATGARRLEKDLAKLGKRALKKLPFIGGLLVGAGLLLAAQEAFAAEGRAGVIRVMTSPENKEAMIVGLASLTGVGSAAALYKDILDASDLKLSKADAFGGAAPEHTRLPGKSGKNCWGNAASTPEADIESGRTKVAGFPHCSELALESMKITQNTLKQLIKEELKAVQALSRTRRKR